MLNSQSVLRNDVIVQHGEFEICLGVEFVFFFTKWLFFREFCLGD